MEPEISYIQHAVLGCSDELWEVPTSSNNSEIVLRTSHNSFFLSRILEVTLLGACRMRIPHPWKSGCTAVVPQMNIPQRIPIHPMFRSFLQIEFFSNIGSVSRPVWRAAEALPADLRGTYFRNGPAKFQALFLVAWVAGGVAGVVGWTEVEHVHDVA